MERNYHPTPEFLMLLMYGGAAVLFTGYAIAVYFFLMSLCIYLLARWPMDAPPPPIIQVEEGMTATKAKMVLGVRQNATLAEIRAAWHKQVQNTHPDRGGSLYLAQMVNSAYTLLSKGRRI